MIQALSISLSDDQETWRITSNSTANLRIIKIRIKRKKTTNIFLVLA